MITVSNKQTSLNSRLFQVSSDLVLFIYTAFLLTIFRNRKRRNRVIVNECSIFCELAELEEYSIYSVYSTSESGIAGRAEIAGIVVIDSQNRMISVPFELE